MSKTYVNTGFAKCFILFMAIVILLEGCVYLGLSIWGITQQDCSHQEMDIGMNPFKSVVDLIYFISQNCDENPTIKLPGLNQATELEINWAKSFMVTNRMYIFMIVYAVISGLWIVASLLVIATICGPVTRLVSAVIFWPWFLVVIAGSILDVVASVFSGFDISHTTSAESTFEYIGVAKPDQNIMSVLGTFDAYFITPAVVMTCISSRVLIIWLLNIFGTSFCLSLSRVLSNQREHHKHHKHQHHHQHDQQQQQQPQSIAAVTNTTTAPTAYNGNQLNQNSNQNLTQQARNDDVEYANVNRPAALVIAPMTQNQTQRQLSSTQLPQRNQAQSPYSANGPALTPDVVVMENVNRQTSPAATGDETTYRKTDSHPDRLDYPPKTPMSPNSTSPLSSDSLLNNRYSQADGGFYSPTAPANQAPQRVSDELRSQLPWSYTSMLGSKPPQPPRKPNIQVYPQIPEPDYNEDTANNQQRSPRAPAGTGVMNDINQSQQAYSRW